MPVFAKKDDRTDLYHVHLGNATPQVELDDAFAAFPELRPLYLRQYGNGEEADDAASKLTDAIEIVKLKKLFQSREYGIVVSTVAYVFEKMNNPKIGNPEWMLAQFRSLTALHERLEEVLKLRR